MVTDLKNSFTAKQYSSLVRKQSVRLKGETMEKQIEEIYRPMNEKLFNNLENQYKELAKVKAESEQVDTLTELLIDFDEMGFAPTTTCPAPDTYAIEWRNKLINALQGYRKQSEVAREIFEEILKNIALNERIKDKNVWVGYHIALVEIKQTILKIEKKYTEVEE